MIVVVLYRICFIFFFYKQKTAYEMRISDWSSDVCSSDLGDQLVHQRTRGGAERRLREEGVSAVQRVRLAALGVGHAQNAAQELLDVGRALDARDGAEDVREGAVPAFLQRLHGDAVLDGARRVEEVDAVQPALLAGGGGALLRWNVLRLAPTVGRASGEGSSGLEM